MSTSSAKSPTELLDRYLQAVRFWLPKTQQQDIIAELSEDLRSQIEEKESELERPLDGSEMSSILKRCGSPMLVASRYQPQRYLIGPALFPIYRFVLKMVLLYILLPVFVLIVGPIYLFSSHDLGLALAHTLSGLWFGAFVAAGIITLIFAVVERTQVGLQLEEKWDPHSLPPVVKSQHRTSPPKMICEAVFGVIGLVWLLLLPHHPFLVFGSAAAFLQAAPIWHRFYLPVLLLAAAGIARPCIALARPQWTRFPALAQLFNNGLTLVFLYFLLQYAIQVPANGWSPFVTLTDAARDSAQYKRVAGLVNLSMLLSIAGTWFGLSIAEIIQVFVLGRQRRQRPSGNHHSAASLVS